MAMTPKIVRENRARDRAETTPPFHKHKIPSQERKASARFSSAARRRPEIVWQNRTPSVPQNFGNLPFAA
jgi:hypothetical protein